MQKELIELQPQLIQTSKETEELIAVIEKESVEVQEVKQVVERDEAIAAKSAQESHAIKVWNFPQTLSEIANLRQFFLSGRSVCALYVRLCHIFISPHY